MTIEAPKLINTYKVGDLTKGKLGEFFKNAYDSPCGSVITHKQLGRFFVQSEQSIEGMLSQTLTTLCGIAIKTEGNKVFARVDPLCETITNEDYVYSNEINSSEINYILAVLNNAEGFLAWLPKTEWLNGVINFSLTYELDSSFSASSIESMINNFLPEYSEEFETATKEEKRSITHIINYMLDDTMALFKGLGKFNREKELPLDAYTIEEGFDEDIFSKFELLIKDFICKFSPVIKDINEDGSYKTILQVYQDEKDHEGFYQIYPVSPK
jgi:hypothetical protein